MWGGFGHNRSPDSGKNRQPVKFVFIGGSWVARHSVICNLYANCKTVHGTWTLDLWKDAGGWHGQGFSVSGPSPTFPFSTSTAQSPMGQSTWPFNLGSGWAHAIKDKGAQEKKQKNKGFWILTFRKSFNHAHILFIKKKFYVPWKSGGGSLR